MKVTGYAGKPAIRVSPRHTKVNLQLDRLVPEYNFKSMPGLSKIRVNISQGIATITLNEPQRLNALSAEGVHYHDLRARV